MSTPRSAALPPRVPTRHSTSQHLLHPSLPAVLAGPEVSPPSAVPSKPVDVFEDFADCTVVSLQSNGEDDSSPKAQQHSSPLGAIDDDDDGPILLTIAQSYRQKAHFERSQLRKAQTMRVSSTSRVSPRLQSPPSTTATPRTVIIRSDQHSVAQSEERRRPLHDLMEEHVDVTPPKKSASASHSFYGKTGGYLQRRTRQVALDVDELQSASGLRSASVLQTPGSSRSPSAVVLAGNYGRIASERSTSTIALRDSVFTSEEDLCSVEAHQRRDIEARVDGAYVVLASQSASERRIIAKDGIERAISLELYRRQEVDAEERHAMRTLVEQMAEDARLALVHAESTNRFVTLYRCVLAAQDGVLQHLRHQQARQRASLQLHEMQSREDVERALAERHSALHLQAVLQTERFYTTCVRGLLRTVLLAEQSQFLKLAAAAMLEEKMIISTTMWAEETASGLSPPPSSEKVTAPPPVLDISARRFMLRRAIIEDEHMHRDCILEHEEHKGFRALRHDHLVQSAEICTRSPVVQDEWAQRVALYATSLEDHHSTLRHQLELTAGAARSQLALSELLLREPLATAQLATTLAQSSDAFLGDCARQWVLDEELCLRGSITEAFSSDALGLLSAFSVGAAAIESGAPTGRLALRVGYSARRSVERLHRSMMEWYEWMENEYSRSSLSAACSAWCSAARSDLLRTEATERLRLQTLFTSEHEHAARWEIERTHRHLLAVFKFCSQEQAARVTLVMSIIAPSFEALQRTATLHQEHLQRLTIFEHENAHRLQHRVRLVTLCAESGRAAICAQEAASFQHNIAPKIADDKERWAVASRALQCIHREVVTAEQLLRRGIVVDFCIGLKRLLVKDFAVEEAFDRWEHWMPWELEEREGHLRRQLEAVQKRTMFVASLASISSAQAAMAQSVASTEAKERRVMAAAHMYTYRRLFLGQVSSFEAARLGILEHQAFTKEIVLPSCEHAEAIDRRSIAQVATATFTSHVLLWELTSREEVLRTAMRHSNDAQRMQLSEFAARQALQVAYDKRRRVLVKELLCGALALAEARDRQHVAWEHQRSLFYGSIARRELHERASLEKQAATTWHILRFLQLRIDNLLTEELYGRRSIMFEADSAMWMDPHEESTPARTRQLSASVRSSSMRSASMRSSSHRSTARERSVTVLNNSPSRGDSVLVASTTLLTSTLDSLGAPTSSPREELVSEGEEDISDDATDEGSDEGDEMLYRDVSRVKSSGDLRVHASLLQLRHSHHQAFSIVASEERKSWYKEVQRPFLTGLERLQRSAIKRSEEERLDAFYARHKGVLRARAAWESNSAALYISEFTYRQRLASHQELHRDAIIVQHEEATQRNACDQRARMALLDVLTHDVHKEERIRRRDIAAVARRATEEVFMWAEEGSERQHIEDRDAHSRGQYAIQQVQGMAAIRASALRRAEAAAFQQILLQHELLTAADDISRRQQVELCTLASTELLMREAMLRRDLEHRALLLLDGQGAHHDVAVAKADVEAQRTSELHALALQELIARETIDRILVSRGAFGAQSTLSLRQEALGSRAAIALAEQSEAQALFVDAIIAQEHLARKPCERDAMFLLKFILLAEAEAESRLDLEELSRANTSTLRRSQSGHGLKSVDRTEDRTRRILASNERVAWDVLSVQHNEAVERWSHRGGYLTAIFLVAFEALSTEETMSRGATQRQEATFRAEQRLIESEAASRVELAESLFAAHAARLQTAEFELEASALEEDALRTISDLSQSSPQMLFEVLIPLCEEEELAHRAELDAACRSAHLAHLTIIAGAWEEAARRALARSWEAERRALWLQEGSSREVAELAAEESAERLQGVHRWADGWRSLQLQEYTSKSIDAYRSYQRSQQAITCRRCQVFTTTAAQLAREQTESQEEALLGGIVLQASMSHLVAAEVGIRRDVQQYESSRRWSTLAAPFVVSLEDTQRTEAVLRVEHTAAHTTIFQSAQIAEEAIARAALERDAQKGHDQMSRDATHRAAFIAVREQEAAQRDKAVAQEMATRTDMVLSIVAEAETYHRQAIADGQYHSFVNAMSLHSALLLTQHTEQVQRWQKCVASWGEYLELAAAIEDMSGEIIEDEEERGAVDATSIFDQLRVHYAISRDKAQFEATEFAEWIALLLQEQRTREEIERRELHHCYVDAHATLCIETILVASMEPMHRDALVVQLGYGHSQLLMWLRYEVELCKLSCDLEPHQRCATWNAHNDAAGVYFISAVVEEEALQRCASLEDEAHHCRYPLKVEEHVALEECCRGMLNGNEANAYVAFLNDEDASYQQALLEQTLREELEACNAECASLDAENEHMMSTLKACMVAFQELEELKKEEHTVVRAFKRANRERRRTEKVLLDFGDADRAEALVTYAEEDTETTQVVQRLWVVAPAAEGEDRTRVEAISVSPHRSSTGSVEAPHVATPLFASGFKRTSEDAAAVIAVAALVPLPRYEFDAANIEARARMVSERLEAVDRNVAQIDQAKHAMMDEVRTSAAAFQDKVTEAFVREMNVLEGKTMLLRGVEEEVLHHVHRGTGTSSEPRPREAVEEYHTELARELTILLGSRSAEETAAEVALASDTIVRLEIGLNAILAEMSSEREAHTTAVQAGHQQLTTARRSLAFIESDVDEMRQRSQQLRDRYLMALAARNQRRLELGKIRRAATPLSSRKGTPIRTPRQGSATPRHATPKTPKTPAGTATPRNAQPPRSSNTPRAPSTSTPRALSTTPLKARASASPLGAQRAKPVAAAASLSPSAPKRNIWR